MLFFAHLWFSPEVCFCSISREQIDKLSPNFVYALVLTRSRMGLLHVILQLSIPELWSLIYARILCMLNILRTNCQIFTILCICIDTDKI